LRSTQSETVPRAHRAAHRYGRGAKFSIAPETAMGRIAALIYGLASYALFVVTTVYAVGFVSGIAVPKTIDSGTPAPLVEALAVNLVLLAIFALQHSIMARKSFKRWWTQFVPEPVERATYVLLSTLALALLFWQWRPLPAVVWQIGDPAAAMIVQGLALLGWVIVFVSTFLISHFELFGLQQVFVHLDGRSLQPGRFRAPGLYRLVRHPLYFGFLVAFWAAPVMTLGHLLFAVATTGYVLVGIALEERDLVAAFGDEYRAYRKRVAMLIPFLRRP
jgi:protein-S-isoprenylcysteine O-methyltransferase Ste14